MRVFENRGFVMNSENQTDEVWKLNIYILKFKEMKNVYICM